LIMPEFSADLKNKNIDIDAGIKAILAILLAAASTLCSNQMDLIYFALYLVVITVLLRSDLRFILKNLASFGLIFVFPYLCGLLLSWLMSRIIPGPIYFTFDPEAILVKMAKIFFIWYIGSLYFFTTPIISIIDMLNRVLCPLNAWGISISKFLNMIMCIINELNRSLSQFKQDVFNRVRDVIKNNRRGLKTKSKGLANILIDFIANSLQRADEIQGQAELIREYDFRYTLRITKNEVMAILSFIVFLVLFWQFRI
jgi:energy-coupling factor transporter transmembrane protein EcfT